MRVMVTGAGGQLARALEASARQDVTCHMLDRAGCDVTDRSSVMQVVTSLSPDVIVNCAAYTAVDRAESERSLSMKVNAEGVAKLADAAATVGAKLIQISTDFVFDGTSVLPYKPLDQANPINFYGVSKLAGERAAQALSDALVVRTAWVYGARGRNFVETMLRLMAEGERISVVSDQVGSPSHADSLARGIWDLIDLDARGIWHFTDAGLCSWYDFAVAIYEEARTLGILQSDVAIIPIRSEEYVQAARRPSFSVLDKSKTWQALGRVSEHWRVELRRMLISRKERIIV